MSFKWLIFIISSNAEFSKEIDSLNFDFYSKQSACPIIIIILINYY